MSPPLPVAVLARRARNAKSPKERHDTAYFAWEASVRLAVSARPPADPAPLALASVGHWVGALALGDDLLDRPALLAALALLSDARPSARTVDDSPRREWTGPYSYGIARQSSAFSPPAPGRLSRRASSVRAAGRRARGRPDFPRTSWRRC